MAITQIARETPGGRAYYRRKRAAGKCHREALRCLKRRLSDVVYRQLIRDAARLGGAGPGGHSGATPTSSAASSNPAHSRFGQVTSRAYQQPPYNRPRYQALDTERRRLTLQAIVGSVARGSGSAPAASATPTRAPRFSGLGGNVSACVAGPDEVLQALSYRIGVQDVLLIGR